MSAIGGNSNPPGARWILQWGRKGQNGLTGSEELPELPRAVVEEWRVSTDPHEIIWRQHPVDASLAQQLQPYCRHRLDLTTNDYYLMLIDPMGRRRTAAGDLAPSDAPDAATFRLPPS